MLFINGYYCDNVLVSSMFFSISRPFFVWTSVSYFLLVFNNSMLVSFLLDASANPQHPDFEILSLFSPYIFISMLVLVVIFISLSFRSFSTLVFRLCELSDKNGMFGECLKRIQMIVITRDSKESKTELRREQNNNNNSFGFIKKRWVLCIEQCSWSERYTQREIWKTKRMRYHILFWLLHKN